MRLVIIFLALLVQFQIFNSCTIQKKSENPEAINAYIEKYLNNQKYDKRIYNSLPPPEWKDSLRHNGKRKPDSIINKLKPLKIYINKEVKYDSTFYINKKLKNGFDFVKEVEPRTQNFFLGKTIFSKKSRIILEFTSSKMFFKKNKENQYNENYGGFTSFKNLYYSKDGTQAIFEISFYKEKLNASRSIIYAKKQSDGTWKFQSHLISIS